MSDQQFKFFGSYGTLLCDADGKVLQADLEYRDIELVDVKEYKAWMKTFLPEVDADADIVEGDILEVGYWGRGFEGREYQLPSAAFRKHVFKEMKTVSPGKMVTARAGIH